MDDAEMCAKKNAGKLYVGQRVCVYVCAQHTQANRTVAYWLQKGQQERWGWSRSLRAAVSLQGHLLESNWETVVVTMSVRAIAMIAGRGQAATQTAVTLPGASQS